ncbi:MAG: DUF4398 domain-containing protein [Pseudomonadota bacterium]|nr:DUF4398 domain-containing protein [Pseudomonadota bacterium]
MELIGTALKAGLAIGTGLFVVGCSSNPPTQLMAQAEYAVEDASEPGIREAAPAEVALARDKYDNAKRAMKDEEYERAGLLAEQAIADARLAEAKARSERAKQAVAELMDAIESLQAEIERNQMNQ